MDILVCRNFWNKYLIMIINHSNRMNFGTHEWQGRVRVNYFKDLDLKMSCNEQSLRTIQVAPPVKALIEMTQHRQDRGRIRILFSIATFNSLGYEAILFSAEVVWYFLWSFLCPLKDFWPQPLPSFWVTLTAPLGKSVDCSISSWEPLGLLCFIFVTFWTLSLIGLLAL